GLDADPAHARARAHLLCGRRVSAAGAERNTARRLRGSGPGRAPTYGSDVDRPATGSTLRPRGILGGILGARTDDVDPSAVGVRTLPESLQMYGLPARTAF